MFIPVITNKDNTIDLNIQQVCYLDGDMAQMTNGFTIYLSDASLKEVKEHIYGSAKEATPEASSHTVAFLTELYQLCGGKGDAKPTSDRKARLKTRLKDFSEDELKIAAKNLGEDAFMQGENDSNKRYGTLDYLIRTSANINKWLEVDPGKPKKKPMF